MKHLLYTTFSLETESLPIQYGFHRKTYLDYTLEHIATLHQMHPSHSIPVNTLWYITLRHCISQPPRQHQAYGKSNRNPQESKLKKENTWKHNLETSYKFLQIPTMFTRHPRHRVLVHLLGPFRQMPHSLLCQNTVGQNVENLQTAYCIYT